MQDLIVGVAELILTLPFAVLVFGGLASFTRWLDH